MSAPGLTSEAQLRYLKQWFGEFSELQREDFLPILAAARSNQPEYLAASVAKLSCQDKPVSLFQCRIKLFNEWFPTWSNDQQDQLIKGVSEIDPVFGSQFQEAMLNGPKVNGDLNGINDFYSSVEDDHKDTNEVQNNEQESENTSEESNEIPLVQENAPLEIIAAS